MTALSLTVVEFGQHRHLDQLTRPDAPRDVFSALEQAICAGDGRLDRFAGRLAAKRALLELEGASPGSSLRTVEIRRGRYGRPVPFLCDGRRSSAALSIAHAGGWAVAAAIKNAHTEDQ